jgi:hypothetical protein
MVNQESNRAVTTSMDIYARLPGKKSRFVK